MLLLHVQETEALAQTGFCNGRGGENDVTFDHTLYIRADPESFGEGDVILN